MIRKEIIENDFPMVEFIFHQSSIIRTYVCKGFATCTSMSLYRILGTFSSQHSCFLLYLAPAVTPDRTVILILILFLYLELLKEYIHLDDNKSWCGSSPMTFVDKLIADFIAELSNDSSYEFSDEIFDTLSVMILIAETLIILIDELTQWLIQRLTLH